MLKDHGRKGRLSGDQALGTLGRSELFSSLSFELDTTTAKYSASLSRAACHFFLLTSRIKREILSHRKEIV